MSTVRVKLSKEQVNEILSEWAASPKTEFEVVLNLKDEQVEKIPDDEAGED